MLLQKAWIHDIPTVMGKYLGIPSFLAWVRQPVLEKEKLWIQTCCTPLKLILYHTLLVAEKLGKSIFNNLISDMLAPCFKYWKSKHINKNITSKWYKSFW